MAVPARRERFRGAKSASELALAGTIYLLAADGLSYDPADVWANQPHPQRTPLYTSCQKCQRFFVTNSTNFMIAPLRLTVTINNSYTTRSSN